MQARAKSVENMDIKPTDASVRSGDFMKFVSGRKKYDIVGFNPPFGRWGCTAKQFIEKAVSMKPKKMCWILPRILGPNKYQVDGYCCTAKEPIDDFYRPFDGKTIKIPCFMWVLERCDSACTILKQHTPSIAEIIGDIPTHSRFHPTGTKFDGGSFAMSVRINGANCGKDAIVKSSATPRKGPQLWHQHSPKHGWTRNIPLENVMWDMHSQSSHKCWLMVTSSRSSEWLCGFVDWLNLHPDPSVKDKIHPSMTGHYMATQFIAYDKSRKSSPQVQRRKTSKRARITTASKSPVRRRSKRIRASNNSPRTNTRTK